MSTESTTRTLRILKAQNQVLSVTTRTFMHKGLVPTDAALNQIENFTIGAATSLASALNILQKQNGGCCRTVYNAGVHLAGAIYNELLGILRRMKKTLHKDKKDWPADPARLPPPRSPTWALARQAIRPGQVQDYEFGVAQQYFYEINKMREYFLRIWVKCQQGVKQAQLRPPPNPAPPQGPSNSGSKADKKKSSTKPKP
ncbi:hypothetical protein PMZ80_002487 [Knufia obscura]|uniref:Uncharacterized protein n=2 Tax=Knufia TaxID=430999 RepID=A0AAN8EJ82_9EURO|nr:hypothetical protein PMZ80_002487 [Knufia obscura]KAK5950805.1 hypothetical protein OHC33_008188 [Knufia fluminis]